MATTKPRITITLEPQTYAILSSISSDSGKPMSGIVSELLESAAPTMERMAAAFQMIRRATDSDMSVILKQLDDAQSVLEPIVMDAVGQYDLFMSKLDGAAAAAGRRGASGATHGDTARRTRSPSTNRGVTPHPIKPTKPATVKASKAKETLKKVLKKGVKKS